MTTLEPPTRSLALELVHAPEAAAVQALGSNLLMRLDPQKSDLTHVYKLPALCSSGARRARYILPNRITTSTSSEPSATS